MSNKFMKPKTILMIVAGLLASCQSTQLNPLVEAGATYVAASPKLSALDKSHIAIGLEIIKTGRLDVGKLVAIATERMADKIPADQRAEVAKLIVSLKNGELNEGSLVKLAQEAAATYAATQGISPAETAAAVAVIKALTQSEVK